MEILLVENDNLTRDRIKVGLLQFPEFNVTTGRGYAGINELRQRHYDIVFLGLGSGDEGLRLLAALREFAPAVDVVMTTSRNPKELAGEKHRLGITAFLQTPIEPRDFFRQVGRLRERFLETAEGRAR